MEEKNPNDLTVSAAAAVMPEMPPEEFALFLADVKERGVQQSLLVGSDGIKVLDGRHRLKAARKLGLLKVPTERADLKGLSEDEFAIRAAVCRRQLSKDQRAMLVGRMTLKLVAESKTERASKGGKTRAARMNNDSNSASPEDAKKDSPRKPRADEALAKSHGLSSKSVKQAVKVLRAAPALAESVEKGEVPLSEAYGTVTAAEPMTLNEDDLLIEVAEEIPAGTHKAEFLGYKSLGYPREVIIVWRICGDVLTEGRLFLQRLSDTSLSRGRLRRDSELGKAFVAICGDASPLIPSRKFGMRFQLVLVNTDNGLKVEQILPTTFSWGG